MSFNLPFGVYVAGADPIDADRYVAADIAARDALITNGRAGNGQQVWVESEKKLYVLEDVSIPTWSEVGGGGGGVPEPGQIIKELEFNINFNDNLTFGWFDSPIPLPGISEIVFSGNFYRVTVQAAENVGNHVTVELNLNASSFRQVLSFQSVVSDFEPPRETLLINAASFVVPVEVAGSNGWTIENTGGLAISDVRIKFSFFE